MTLLFFLRSPAGITDVGAAPGAEGWYYDEREELKRKRLERRLEVKALRAEVKRQLIEQREVEKQLKRKRRRRDEEMILQLLAKMDYDD